MNEILVPSPLVDYTRAASGGGQGEMTCLARARRCTHATSSSHRLVTPPGSEMNGTMGPTPAGIGFSSEHNCLSSVGGHATELDNLERWLPEEALTFFLLPHSWPDSFFGV